MRIHYDASMAAQRLVIELVHELAEYSGPELLSFRTTVAHCRESRFVIRTGS